MLYQQTGQTTKAREMYESVLALRPRDSDRLVSLSESPKPISDLANAGLAQIEGRPSTAALAAEPPAAGVGGSPSASLMLGRTAAPPGGPPVAQMRPLGPGVAEAAQRSSPIGPRFTGTDNHIVSRLPRCGRCASRVWSRPRNTTPGAKLTSVSCCP